MAIHDEVDRHEAADRLAIRELFDAYAHYADRRDAVGQKALITENCTFTVYMAGEGTPPTYVLHGREALTPVFEGLHHQYDVTMHFNGQSTATLDGDRATGDSYTIAHHVFEADGERRMMVAYLRYLDVVVKVDGAWYIDERELIVDWSEVRPSVAA
jgi:hypothetical protein